MNVDPRLNRLLTVIEQKHNQQLQQVQQKSVGRPGSERFAEAANRVRNHLANNQTQSRVQYTATNRTTYVERNSRVESVRSFDNPLHASSTDGKLSTTQVHSNQRPGEGHLGRYLDVYA